jgi:molecular chaperone GrpE (heat shock protein)
MMIWMKSERKVQISRYLFFNIKFSCNEHYYFLFKDKYMRALAENQNTLKRMRKQVEDAKVYGVQNLVKDLLEVGIDSLRLPKLHNSSCFR